MPIPTEDVSSNTQQHANAAASRTVVAWAVGASVLTSLLFVSFLFLFVYQYREDLLVSSGSTEHVATVAHTPPVMEQTGEHSIADVVEQVSDAVVSVVVTKDVPIVERYYEYYDPWGGLMPFGGFEVPRTRQRGTEELEVGGGSGFFVLSDGLVVTNRHVVDDVDARYSIVTNDGESYDAEVLVRDTQLDIAVLRVRDIPGDAYTSLTFGDSNSLRPGETVIAIGNALTEFRNSVSVGVVSGLSRSITAGDRYGRSTEQLEGVIQTDAAINPGNSGGPLLNTDGQVIGVNVAVAGGAENIGFAIPSNMVARAVESVERYGEIRRPYLGVRYLALNQTVADNNELPVDYGAWLKASVDGPAVLKGSPAEDAGLREDDIIVEVDGTSLREMSLVDIVRQKDVDEVANVIFLRNGEERAVEVRLRSFPTE